MIFPAQNVQELQAKIDKLRDTILDFSKIEKQTYRGVKQLFSEIIQDAERLKIDKNELRRMLHEAFHAKGPRAAKISGSYLRRLLPGEYKYSAKARLDYKLKQEKEEQKSEKRITGLSTEVPQLQAEQISREEESQEVQRLMVENKQQQEEIEMLRSEINLLKEQEEIWTATGVVPIDKMQVPLIITVNTKQKKIENVELDIKKARESI